VNLGIEGCVCAMRVGEPLRLSSFPNEIAMDYG